MVDPSPLNAALTWLQGALPAALPANSVVKRNEPLPEDISSLPCFVVLTDGADPNATDREDLLGTATRQYSFEREVPVDVYVQDRDDASRTAKLYARAAEITDVVLGDRTLGGSVGFADIAPATSDHEQPGMGVVPIARLSLGLLLIYDTDNPLG